MTFHYRTSSASPRVLDAIGLDSLRVEKQAMQRIMLPDEDAEIDPLPGAGGGHRGDPELDRLSNILRHVQRALR